jgi:hypothetical protein
MRAIFALIIMLLSTVAALAADPIFPAASAIGLTPPPGMVVAPGFAGFRDETIGGAILLTKFPADAFDQIVAGASDDAKFAAAGIFVRTRENLTIGGNPAFLATGRQVIGGINFRYWGAIVKSSYGTAVVNAQYPEAVATRAYDDAIRAALTSITLRPEPSIAEQVAALPFTLPDLGKFRIDALISGYIVGLTDGPKDMDPEDTQTHFLVTVSQRVPPPELHQTAARQSFVSSRRRQVVDVRSEAAITIGGLDAYQIIGRVRSERGVELTDVQWMVFADDLTLMMDATSRPEKFDIIWQQLLAIRDGVHLK